MKRILLAGLALGALALGAPAATADDGHTYAGGCDFTAVNDTTPNEIFDGEESWDGVISILARSTDGGDPAVPTTHPITVTCDLYKNGVLFVYHALSASGGGGVTAAFARLQFWADATDVITVCEAVEAATTTYHCDDARTTPIESVQEAITLVIETLNDNVISQIGPTICPVLASHAPGAGPVVINDEGDVYLFGDTYHHLWWDCPPYEEPPAA